jgi:hypothetical protein
MPTQRVGGCRSNLPRPRSSVAAQSSPTLREQRPHSSASARFSAASTTTKGDFHLSQVRPWDTSTYVSGTAPYKSGWDRIDPPRKDHRLYETQQERGQRKMTLSKSSSHAGQLYDVHEFGRRGLELGGTEGGVEMRQTSMDFGANAILRRKALVRKQCPSPRPAAGS